MITLACWLEGDEFFPLARMAIASARRSMPNARVVLLTNIGVTLPALGADEVMALPLPDVHPIARQMAAFTHVQGDAVFFGADTLFLADVSEVFEQSFDIAVPHIRDRRFSHDAGIVFGRSPELWRRLVQHPVMQHREYPGPTPCVIAFNDLVTSHPEVVRRIPGATYSYVPVNESDDCAGASIVHFRGPRKRFMRGHFERWAGATN